MNDTIAAQSTAPGAGLRAVVRVSGPAAFSLAGRMLARGPDPGKLKGFSAPPVFLALSGGGEISARMLVMRAPRSYTTEDVVEFHLLGAQPLAEKVLKRCLEEGARLAEPGEFTKRAYLAGRIDGAQVKGVISLIESRSDEDRRASLHLLQGNASKEAATVRRDLVDTLAALEAYLDFVDEDTEAVDKHDLRSRLRDCLVRLDRIESQVARRIPMRNWPRVVLLGPPNAGKSSLFRALVPKGRALISPEPGTTRDLLEGEVHWGEKSLLLYDAPGVAETRNPLERLAISRLAAMMARMEAALIVLDGSAAPPRDEILSIIRLAGTCPRLFILNKNDLGLHEAWREFGFDPLPIPISSLEGVGTDRLLDRLCAFLPSPMGEGGIGLDLDTAACIRKSKKALMEALNGDWEGGVELVAMELREATDSIGRLAGRIDQEEVLQTVFSKFCIGK